MPAPIAPATLVIALALGAPATQPATQPAANLHGPAAPTRADAWREMERKLDAEIAPIELRNVPAGEALVWWSKATGIDLTLNRAAMQEDGLDLDRPVTLVVTRMSARRLLLRLAELASPDQRLICELSPYAVDVMTKAQANRNPVVRMYDVADLLVPIGEMVQVAAAGSAGTSPGLRAPAARGGDEVSRLIRRLIEPSVWDENGGTATIEYFQGKLIVKAPLYVQMQIGKPLAVLRDTTR